MDRQPILSICIPTNGVVEWVIPVVESIYAQKVNNNLFEVVITDNGGKGDLERALQAYSYPNLHYYKTNAQGFTNQIDAFEKCSGLFCKMLNHRSKMMQGSIRKLIDIVERYKNEKPIIYCAEGYAKGGAFIECQNTDEFVKSMSFLISWSVGTGAWRSDLTDIRKKEIIEMFPHTTFLLGLRKDSNYVIWNERYEVMMSDAGKGGYDVFYTFGVTFLDLLNNLRVRERITPATFVSVKRDLYGFLRRLYMKEVLLPTKHTFIIQDIADSMDVYYGRYYYWKMLIWAYIHAPFAYFKRVIKEVVFKGQPFGAVRQNWLP